MVVSYTTQADLQQQVLFDRALRRVQGAFLQRRMFGRARAPAPTFDYFSYGRIFKAAIAAEGAVARLNPEVVYSKSTLATTYYSRKTDLITVDATRALIRDPLRDEVQEMQDAILLTVEDAMFTEIDTNASVQEITLASGEEWDDATPGDALDDFLEAMELLVDDSASKAEGPFSIIIDAHDVRSILALDAVRDLVSGTGALQGVLAKLDPFYNQLFVHNVSDETGTNLMSDKALAFKNDEENALILEWEPLGVDRWYDREQRGWYIMYWINFLFHLFRPARVVEIKNTRA